MVGANEALRLRALSQSEILDTPPEPAFDELTALAASICGTPMAIITLIDEKRQWFKSQFGLALNETPRDIAFCNTTIQRRGLTIVEDAFQDSRFTENPLVHANVGIRFYAGVPLITRDGNAIGALAVLDYIPRRLLPNQREALVILGRSVMNQIELRRYLVATKPVARTKMEALPDPLIDAVSKTLQPYSAGSKVTDIFPGLFFLTDISGKILRHNPKAARFVDFFGAPAHIQELVATDMREDFIEHQQKANETARESFKTIFVDPENGRHAYLVALERWTDRHTYFSWAALALTRDDPRDG